MTENCKSVWVTDMCLIQKAGIVALGTTARILSFYDISGNRFEKVLLIIVAYM